MPCDRPCWLRSATNVERSPANRPARRPERPVPVPLPPPARRPHRNQRAARHRAVVWRVRPDPPLAHRRAHRRARRAGTARRQAPPAEPLGQSRPFRGARLCRAIHLGLVEAARSRRRALRGLRPRQRLHRHQRRGAEQCECEGDTANPRMDRQGGEAGRTAAARARTGRRRPCTPA